MDRRSSDQPPIPFTPGNVAHGVTVVTHERELHMYRLTAGEIDTICEAGNYKALDLGLFSICIAVFVTLLVTLLTVDTLTQSVQRSFVSVTYISAIGSIYFGARFVIAWVKAKRTLRKIKGEM